MYEITTRKIVRNEKGKTDTAEKPPSEVIVILEAVNIPKMLPIRR